MYIALVIVASAVMLAVVFSTREAFVMEYIPPPRIWNKVSHGHWKTPGTKKIPESKEDLTNQTIIEKKIMEDNQPGE